MIKHIVTSIALTTALAGCFKRDEPKIILATDHCIRIEMYQSCLLMLPTLLVGDPSNNWTIERCGEQSSVVSKRRATTISPSCKAL